jgi:tripartite-type tricarboxylate transporter receptor subunit TctC
MRARFRYLAFAVALAAPALVSPTQGQTYPDRPVRLVVPFPAGGGVDTMARVLGQKLSEFLKQPVLIEHRPGAGGNIGADAVAKAAPDGYTVLLTVNTLSSSPAIYKKLSYDPLKDLVPITQISASQFVLTGSPKLEANTVQEMIALAKARPGSLNYGSSGVGAPLHFQAEMLKFATGIDIAHIPYRGDAPMLTALLSGDVHFAFMPQTTGAPQVLNKQLKGFAVTGRKRQPTLPDLPTLMEVGIRGLEDGSWYGLFVPAGTPPAIAQKLQQETAKTVAMAEIRDRLISWGQEPLGTTSQEFEAFFKADVAKFIRIVEAARIPKLD